jgi:hypothetical protein
MSTENTSSLEFINADKFVQHNLALADGIVGVKAFTKTLPTQAVSVNTVRGY